MIKFYQYSNCTTCKKAAKFLNEYGVSYEPIDIVQHTPTKKEFEEFLCSIRNVPEIPNRQVIDILEGYKNSDLYVDLIDYILNSD